MAFYCHLVKLLHVAALLAGVTKAISISHPASAEAMVHPTIMSLIQSDANFSHNTLKPADKASYFLQGMDGERPGWLQARPHPNVAILSPSPFKDMDGKQATSLQARPHPNAARLSSNSIWGTQANVIDRGSASQGPINEAIFRANNILKVHSSMIIAIGLPVCCYILYCLYIRHFAKIKDGKDQVVQQLHLQAGAEKGVENQDSIWSLLCMIGPLWPGLLATALGSSISGTSEQFITLNWFATQHDPKFILGPIHCDTNNLDPRCQAGVHDSLSVSTLLSLVTPVLHFLMGPGLGALSDSLGRRPIFVVTKIIFMVPVLAMAAHVYFGTSLVYYLFLSPLGDIPAYVVHYAYIVDRIPDHTRLMVAFALMGAASRIFMLCGMMIGVFLSMTAAYTLSFAMQVLALLYTMILLPESLPKEKRKKLKLNSLFPIMGLGILFRNDALRRLTYIIILSSFVDSGFTRIMPSYMMMNLPWDRNAQYWGNMTFSISVVAWLTVGVWYLQPILGEVGMLFLGRLCCFFWGIPQMVSTRVWHIWAVNGMFAGPISLTMPVIASMKSQLVSNDEQGRMQGALATITDLASALGPLVLGKIFNATNRSPVKTASSNLIIYVCILASIPILALVTTLPAALKHHRIKW